MEYYEQLLSRLKLLNPGTKFLINRVFNKEKYSFLKEMVSLLKKINEKEDEVKNLTKQQMREKTEEFKKRIADGEPLDNFIVDAFAMVREAARRTLNMRHFDVQILGGIVLHRGKIAEMATGEGKTLVATLPLYLNALEGKGCHLVTVNDYLAKRDTQWMGPIFDYLGLSVGCIISFKEAKGPYSSSAFKFDPTYLPADSRFLYLSPVSRKEAYMCDITYGVGSEFGFDYLRDNMAIRKEDQVQRKLNYAIIDEVDSILIDEARTPLIISGPSEESPQLYYEVDRLVRKLVRDKDFVVDEEGQTTALTEEGIKKCERLLGIANLYDGAHTELVHHINQALRAHTFFKRDKEYVVRDGKVIIVDEFTGRLMPGRRWSDGLHQAIEAKEGVRIESENQTLATISFQNYFKLYKKIAGMTGTAITEGIEFKEIYKLDVIVIPTNKPLRRTEYDDEIYRTEREKFNSIVEEIEQLYKIGRPVLIGTTSIEKAEKLSRFLRRKNIPHKVLHGKNHEAEAAIIAQAGRPKSVTIATQMAGRGVDIILGGNPEILAREETIKVIWSKKASERRKKPVKKEYLEVINELDEEYKKKTDQIEKKHGEKLKDLRNKISEKEKKFNEIDKIAREKLEREIFEKNIENFEKYEKKLQKLKEKYEENNNQLISLSEKYKDKPERLKEIKEITGKSYRDYVIFKNSIKAKDKITTGEDIEEKRNILNEFIEKNSFEDRKKLREILNSLSFTIKNYIEILEKTFPFITSAEETNKGKKKINIYLSLLQDFEKKFEKEENPENLIPSFSEKEVRYYQEVKKSFENIEKRIFENYFAGYISIEKEYTHLLSEYEKEQIKYSKELKKAREEYERERSKYEEEWQKAREELEKSPEEFKEIFENLLEKYKKPWEKDHQKVVELGGLHVIGSERYEARRIDNQLKGRAGRQGDPGSSKFYLSLEDDLLRIFGSDRLMGLMGRMPEGEKITHPLITKMINNAQKKVEARNFEIRKQLVEFDNVLNEQRNIIYSLRQDVLEGKNVDEYIFDFISDIIENIFEEFMPSNLKPLMWNLDGFKNIMRNTFGIEIQLPEKEEITNPSFWREKVKEEIKEKLTSFYNEKKKQIGEFFPEIQKIIFLQVIDNRWKAHLRAIDELREGISLRAYAQRDPLVAYKHEGYQIFEEMLYSVKQEILSYLFKIQVSEEMPVARIERKKGREIYQHESLNQFDIVSQPSQVEAPVGIQPPSNLPLSPQVRGKPQPYVRGKKIGRNDPCPCGSGKKYKHCCGKNV